MFLFKFTNKIYYFIVIFINYQDGELVPLSRPSSPDVPESEIVERRITRSQRRTAAQPVTSALNVCENHDCTINIVHDIEMNPMTDIWAQDESTNHENVCSTNESLSGSYNQNGKHLIQYNVIIECLLIFIESFRCS